MPEFKIRAKRIFNIEFNLTADTINDARLMARETITRGIFYFIPRDPNIEAERIRPYGHYMELVIEEQNTG
jgi:hypothetical protein